MRHKEEAFTQGAFSASVAPQTGQHLRPTTTYTVFLTLPLLASADDGIDAYLSAKPDLEEERRTIEAEIEADMRYERDT